MLCAMQRPTHELASIAHTTTVSDANRSFATDPFIVTGASSRVDVEGDANIRNQWASFDLGLIDEKTGERYDQQSSSSNITTATTPTALGARARPTTRWHSSAIPAGSDITYWLSRPADPTMSELSFSSDYPPEPVFSFQRFSRRWLWCSHTDHDHGQRVGL